MLRNLTIRVVSSICEELSFGKETILTFESDLVKVKSMNPKVVLLRSHLKPATCLAT